MLHIYNIYLELNRVQIISIVLKKLIIGNTKNWIDGKEISMEDHTHSASDITSGTLPVARGGTNITSNPSILVNLGSTIATNVFASAPRPGITGTLGVNHGGTGRATLTSGYFLRGNGTGAVTLSSINQVKDALGIEESNIPSGVIVMWSGTSSNIPSGWHLCDGTSGTPNLRDRFVVGAGSTYDVGDTGGEATHKLTINEMPSHTHSSNLKNSNQDGGNIVYAGNSFAPNFTVDLNLSSSGGDQPHNNLPPYYALCFIMKL